MTTYKRDEILQKVLNHYCKTPHLNKIIVIWNNIGTPVPGFLLNISTSCAVPLKFVKETENKLTRRFKPRPEIETDCTYVCNIEYLVTVWDSSIASLSSWCDANQ